jgi:hypothetical protein
MSQGQQAVVDIRPSVNCTVSEQKRDHLRPYQAAVLTHMRSASNEVGTLQKGETSTWAANGQPPRRTICVFGRAERQHAFHRKPSSRITPMSHQHHTVTAESIDHQIPLKQQVIMPKTQHSTVVFIQQSRCRRVSRLWLTIGRASTAPCRNN